MEKSEENQNPQSGIELEAEAKRIANWLNKYQDYNARCKIFLEYLLSYLDGNYYEKIGILDEVKVVLREIISNDEEDCPSSHNEKNKEK